MDVRELSSVSSLRHHPGIAAVHSALVDMYLGAIDVLEKSSDRDLMLKAQAKIEVINSIAGLFEQADFVERDARRQLVDERLKSMTTPTE